MLVTTTFTIEGNDIVEYKGVVRGIRYDASEVVTSATEVLGYGPAVVVRRAGQA